MNLNTSHISLEYVEGGSNKFYRMTYVYNRYGVRSLLIKNWGAIGKEGQYTFTYGRASANGPDYDKTTRDKLKKGYSEIDRVGLSDQEVTDTVTRLKVYGVGRYAVIEGRPLIDILTEINGSKGADPAPDGEETVKIALEKVAQVEILMARRLKDANYGSW